VISGNASNGILINSGSLISDSEIGTDSTGSIDLGNTLLGISATGSNNTIQFSTISGNGSAGIGLLGNNNEISFSYIGTNPTGATLGNDADGVLIQNGFNNTASGNSIAFNGANRIRIIGKAIGNSVGENDIYSNTALGIELGSDGITPNDPGDTDFGPNGLQNYPVLTSAIRDASIVSVEGTLNSLPNTEFTIDAYWNTSCDPSGFGEGEHNRTFGQIQEITDSNGNLSFQISFSLEDVPVGSFFTAVATRRAGGVNADSSEFSSCIQEVNSDEPTCTLDPSYALVELGGQISVKATILDGIGNPLPGAPIRFSYSGSDGAQGNEHRVTNSQGEAFTSQFLSLVPYSLDVDADGSNFSCNFSSIIEWRIVCEEIARSEKSTLITDDLQRFVQHPRLTGYRKQLLWHTAEALLLFNEKDLGIQIDAVMAEFAESISALSDGGTALIDTTSWRMLQDLIASFEQKATPEFKKVLNNLRNDLHDPQFQREIGLIVAHELKIER
jgi:hypothetical protein